MKVINGKKNSHVDYANVTKSKNLTVNAGNQCEQRDLPCGRNTR